MSALTNRGKVIQLRVTEEEQSRYKAAAASENLGLSEWIRKRCEGLTEPPVALQSASSEARHPGGKKKTAVVLVEPENPTREGEPVEHQTAKAPEKGAISGSTSTPSGQCSRTGFPVEACLCPQCKKLK